MPAGRLPEEAEAVAPAARLARLPGQLNPVVHLRPERVPALERGGDPVDGLVLLGREGPEQPVPDDQRPPVVAVEVLGVPPVVDPVVGGGVEDPFEGAQPADEPGVDPELVQRVEGGDGQEHEGREAEKGHGQVEDPGEGGLESPLPQGHREVHLLALVVDDVRRPARVRLVAPAVEPVVESVHPEEADGPGPGRRARDREEPPTLEEDQVAGEQDGLEEDLHHLVEDPAGEVVDRVVQPIDVPLQEPGGQELDPDQQEEDRDREMDVVDVH